MNTKFDKLSKEEHEDMVYDLVQGVVQAKSLNDAALFLQDLLTKSEMKILAKRLRIAKFLLKGATYNDIETELNVSHGTIAKIAAWLAERGEGFRNTIKNLPERTVDKKWFERSEWDSIKRKYSLYFWPELLLEEIIKNANKRQKDRIKDVLEKLDDKTELHKKIQKLLGY